ncbi:esterase/lipase family protein [Dietzia cinnamea]|uniref:Triacylglycerol esterase/lipase EstA (Alpha/beta hydrolase family) n=1 Tax=Dietzia cinnamea TaxID=321318 RepID=A0A4R3ZMC0_9ACTN|nr:alpha/beta fold hydrolase [Dietzia cinnamea]TCW20509.1 triacylglycerol esterase/lipase EstA (alpha/beta hydrolase family) [Dietzia cinnamea]
MLGSRTPARPSGRRPARGSTRRSARSRLAGALAALALAVPLAAAVGSVQVGDLAPRAHAQSTLDQLGPLAGQLGPLAGQLGPLADALRDADPAGELGPYVTEALNGINGPIGAPGPPAAVDAPVTCRPAPARPRPVILVHGTFDNGANTMPRLGEPLRRQGFCVVAPTLGAYAGNPARGGLDSIVAASGPQLAGVIDHVRAVTGAPQVDLVGYSQGAAIAGYTTKVLRPGAVANVVSVGGYWGADNSGLIPHQLPREIAGLGLWAANLRGLAELSPGSPMITAWYGLDRTPFLPGVGYTLIATRGDHLLPPERSFVPGPGVRWVVTEDACGGGPNSHGGMVVDGRTHALVAEALGGAAGC